MGDDMNIETAETVDSGSMYKSEGRNEVYLGQIEVIVRLVV